MESTDTDHTVSPSSEPRTPVRCAHPRPRSSTMIPYVELNDRTSFPQPGPPLPSPVPRLLSPFPDLTPGKEPSVQPDTETPNLAAPLPPARAVSPFPCHPFVTDAESLQAAVSANASRILEAIQNLVNERDGLRVDLTRTSAELQSVTEDLTNTRIDHKAARHRYEELFRVASAKQVILWKYIESLHSQLAAAKGQPDPNLGAGHGLGMVMSVRGGPGMGVAMEKWISEGMDGDKGSRHGEEGSEEGTEHSVWSADDSVGTKSLDPKAKQTFVPQLGSPKKFRPRSPGKVFKNRSPDRSSGHFQPSSPMKNSSYAVQDPFQDQPQGQHNVQAMLPPAKLLQQRLPPNSLIAPLPPRWFGICPFSLANASPCPLGVNCQFVPLCPSYNNDNGIGCALFNKGGPSACRFAHEYRFCEDVISGKKGGCVWETDILGKHPATMEQVKKKREIHMRVRAHKSHCDIAEWEARVVLLSMREAHVRGMFNV